MSDDPVAPLLAHRRQFLVIVRAGARALHLDWALPADRRWDLVTLAYDERVLVPDPTGPARTVGDVLFDSRQSPSKFTGLQAFFTQYPQLLAYDAVLMPDDDLLFDPIRINSMFDLFMQSGAAVGQPALTWDSHFSHLVTLRNRSFVYRFTNFAEVMVPLMTGAALTRFLPTFTVNKSSWGMDCLWAKLCADTGQRVVVLDQTPVQHTRPVGGAGLYQALGVDPAREAAQLFADFQFSPPAACVFGGVLDEHFGLPRSGALLESLVAGLHPQHLRHPGFVPMIAASAHHLT